MRKLIRAVACTIAVAVAACATGGPTDPGAPVAQDAPNRPPGQADAPRTSPDAARPPDGAVPHDASMVLPDASVTPDAAAGSGGQICAVNGDCPDPGTCCFIAVCVPGAGLGSDLCFPS